jgi:hypothetical protein
MLLLIRGKGVGFVRLWLVKLLPLSILANMESKSIIGNVVVT